MARTAIVNPKRKRRAAPKRRRSYGRRRNPSTRRARRAAPKRRRRRNPGAPSQSVYSSGGYRRRNPDFFDFDRITEVMPAATLGNWAARWAAKMAGPFEVVEAGKPAVPTLKHAFAMVMGAQFGSQAIGSMLGTGKEQIAYHGALGFAGDLFMRTRMLENSQWVRDNLVLSGVDYEGDYTEDAPGEYADDMSGFEETSALGDDGQYVIGPDGALYQLQGVAEDAADFPGGSFDDDDELDGFEQTSALGFSRAYSNENSSFGYSY